MEFSKLLEERRSIRKFDPEKKVTADQIKEIINAAIQAPSWKNSQTTRYYAVVTPEKIEAFSAACLPEFNQKSAAGAALVVTTFVKDRSGFDQEGNPNNEVGNGWGYYDLGLHDENFILKARDLGLDTLIMGIRDEKAIREFLSIPEEELHRAILKAVQDLAANFTDEVAAQINGILHDIQTGESTMPNLQEQLEQTQQEFDRLLEMSLDFDEDTPFLDDRLKKLNNKIKSLKKAIEDSTARQEKVSQPEMLLSAKDLQIQEYDDALTARIIEKITVRARNEIEIRFIGGYKKTMRLA